MDTVLLFTLLVGIVTIIFFATGQKIQEIFQKQQNQKLLEKYSQYIKDVYQFSQKINIQDIFDQLKEDNLEPNQNLLLSLLQITIKKNDLRSVLKLFKYFQNNNQTKECYQKNELILLQNLFKYLTQNEVEKEDIKQFCIDLKPFISQTHILFVIEQSLKLQVIEPLILFYSFYETNISFQIQSIKSFKAQHAQVIKKYYKNLIDKYLQSSVIQETVGNMLLEISLKIGDLRFSDVLFEKLKPTVNDLQNLYQTMIRGISPLKQYDYMMQVYTQIQENQNLEINDVAFGQIIDCCVKCRKLDRAQQILNQNRDTNTIVYTTLLKGFARERQFDKAWQVFSSMKQKTEKNAQPNTVTYNSMLECAVQSQEFDKMDELFKEITEGNNQEIQPDLITYSTYIKGLCKAKDIQQAIKLFNQVRDEKKFQVDEVLYNSLIDGLFKAKECQLCLEIYEKMKEDGISLSNVTYSILIKLYNQLGQYQEALDVLDIMRTRFIQPGIIVYTCLVQTCVKSKNMEKMVSIYQQMKEQDISGDSVFYNTLVSGLIFNNYIKSALEITLDILEKNIILNNEVYSNLIKNLLRISERRKSIYSRNNEQVSLTQDEVQTGLLKLIQELKRLKIYIDQDIQNRAQEYIFNPEKYLKENFLARSNNSFKSSMSRNNKENSGIFGRKFHNSNNNRNQFHQSQVVQPNKSQFVLKSNLNNIIADENELGESEDEFAEPINNTKQQQQKQQSQQDKKYYDSGRKRAKTAAFVKK